MTAGWAFLVARGRRQGHRARLVPAVLAELGLAGLVEENRSADTPAGRVTLVSRTHRIRPEDVDSTHVLDEHGRPLDISYGFVHLEDTLPAIDEADVATALAQALDVYRRFLADESGFATELSTPFPLRSTPAQPPPTPAAARPSRFPALTRPSRTTVGLGAAALLAAILAVPLLGVPRGGPPGDDLTGTWRNATVNVTVTCEPGCPVEPGTVIGTMRAACDYTLVLERPVDGMLRATASHTTGGDCLPDGRIVLRRTATDRTSLEWHNAVTGDLVLEADLQLSDA
jgi:hypothetical protein